MSVVHGFISPSYGRAPCGKFAFGKRVSKDWSQVTCDKCKGVKLEVEKITVSLGFDESGPYLRREDGTKERLSQDKGEG